MNNTNNANLISSISKYPKLNDEIIKYGTAGFRTLNSKLDYVLFRMGILAAARSQSKQGASIGMMITASHNPEQDNGVKLVDPLGEMLSSEWEKIASEFVAVSDEHLLEDLSKIITAHDLESSISSRVTIARDTRSSSERLSEAAIAGAKAYGAIVKDYGVLTTPQLHYMVRCINTDCEYGIASEDGYYEKISKAYNKLNEGKLRSKYCPCVTVDGANGVGALKLEVIKKHLKTIEINVLNDGSKGKLNHECGADYVKIQQSAPSGFRDIIPGGRYASFDGDADRIVYFFKDNNSTFHLLDGDKIATLIASYLKTLVSQCSLPLNFGIIQTAYANGASTKYIRDKLKITAACTCTGVKHLHHKALDFDIGVYFEANGHGTVIFSDSAKVMIKDASTNTQFSEENRKAASSLLLVIDLINETVGDAISDLLLVETILNNLDIDVFEWNDEYTDLPNRQMKVKVADRTAITTKCAETICVTPAEIQPAIDALVRSLGQSARSFVRPSGTEDIVRVYAEAETKEEADKLVEDVCSAVKLYA